MAEVNGFSFVLIVIIVYFNGLPKFLLSLSSAISVLMVFMSSEIVFSFF